jgi:type IV pilus assembly protein PilB
MSLTIAPAVEDVVERPRGLVPPTRRGRSRRLIGEVIVDLGFARREEVEQAVATAREHGRTTGQILIESGVVRHDQLARALAERFGVDFIDLSVFEIDMGAVSLVPADVARRYGAVPVGFLPDRTVLLAMSDPTNVVTQDEISMMIGRKVTPAAVEAEDLAAVIARLGRLDETVAEVHESAEEELEVSLQEGAVGEAPIVKLVHSIIAQAVEQGASDIHCNPEPGDSRPLDVGRGRLADQDHGEHRHRRTADAARRAPRRDYRWSTCRRARRNAAAGQGRGGRDADPRYCRRRA